MTSWINALPASWLTISHFSLVFGLNQPTVLEIWVIHYSIICLHEIWGMHWDGDRTWSCTYHPMTSRWGICSWYILFAQVQFLSCYSSSMGWWQYQLQDVTEIKNKYSHSLVQFVHYYLQKFQFIDNKLGYQLWVLWAEVSKLWGLELVLAGGLTDVEMKRWDSEVEVR